MTGECNGRSFGIDQIFRAAVKFSPALLFLAVLAGCSTAQTTTFEPQNQPLDGRQGRLYLIRHSSVMSGYGAPPIKANGKLVGELAAGTYFVVDRPPGTHKITVYGIRDTIGCETDVSFQPGMSHYFELGPIVRINMDGFIAEFDGCNGTPRSVQIRRELAIHVLFAGSGRWGRSDCEVETNVGRISDLSAVARRAKAEA